MYNDTYLMHHGVKGQRWGVRRYQDYDGHRIGAKRRSKSIFNTIKAERLKKKEAKRVEQEKARQTSIEELKKRAVTNGDVDTILKLKGEMTTNELKDAAARMLAIKQIDQYRLPKEKSGLEKFIARLDKAKTTVDSIKNFHKSFTDLKDQLSGKTKDNNKKNDKNNKNQNQNEQQEGKKKKDKNKQEQNNDKGGDSLEKLANILAKKLNDGSDKKNNQPKETKPPKENQQKKGLLDLWEDDKDPMKNGEITDSWRSPNLLNRAADSSKKINLSNIVNTNRENASYLSKLKSVGSLFSDSTEYSRNSSEPSGHYINRDGVGVRVPEINSSSNLMKAARETAVSELANRNARGWTAQNNDDWLKILNTASTIHVSEGNIWEERYGKKN